MFALAITKKACTCRQQILYQIIYTLWQKGTDWSNFNQCYITSLSLYRVGTILHQVGAILHRIDVILHRCHYIELVLRILH